MDEELWGITPGSNEKKHQSVWKKPDLDVELRVRVHVVEKLLVVVELLVPFLSLCVAEVITQGCQNHLGPEELGLLSVLVQQHQGPWNRTMRVSYFKCNYFKQLKLLLILKFCSSTLSDGSCFESLHSTKHFFIYLYFIWKCSRICYLCFKICKIYFSQ